MTQTTSARSRLLKGLMGGAAALTLLSASSAPMAQILPSTPEPPKPSSEPQDFLKAPPRPGTVKGPFSLVSIGDLLYSHPVMQRDDPAMKAVFKLIQSGDVTIANREGVFFDFKGFQGQGYGGGGLWGEASMAPDMKAMGIKMVSMANNHSTDWGWRGLLDSEALLDKVGIVHAGGGRNLQEASKAAVYTTSKGVRVALVSTAASFKENAGAMDAFVQDDGQLTPARPGISILRTRIVHLVNADQLAKIKSLATDLAWLKSPAPNPKATRVRFDDNYYQLSDKTGLSYEMDLYDHARLLKSIREAKEQADLVVFTIHAHQSTTGDDDDTPAPPDFLITLFHNAVDAGADVIQGGGPHSLRGVEIYKGKVILYGLGAFFIRGQVMGTQESADHVFPDATGHAPPPKPPNLSVRAGGNPASWYDGMVAITDYDAKGKAATVRIYPLDTGNTYEPLRRGMPHLADPAYGARILAELQSDSAQFGTRIDIENGVGVIRIP